MKFNNIYSDYSYCSGVACKLRKYCKRYLPDPPDTRLWWVPVEYREETETCVHFESLD